MTKTYLITGAASDIGRGLVLRLLAKDGRVLTRQTGNGGAA